MGAPSGNAGSRKPHRVSKRDWRTEVYATAHPVCPHLWNPAQKSTRSRMLFRLGRIEWWRALTVYVKAASVNTGASSVCHSALLSREMVCKQGWQTLKKEWRATDTNNHVCAQNFTLLHKTRFHLLFQMIQDRCLHFLFITCTEILLYILWGPLS